MSTPNKTTLFPTTRARTRRAAAAHLTRGVDRREERREIREALEMVAARVVNVRV